MKEDQSYTSTIPNFIQTNAWLVFEFLGTIILITLLLGYNDFDDNLKLLTRGFIVLIMWEYGVGAAHMLAVRRKAQNVEIWNKKHPDDPKADFLPCFVAYGFVFLRLIFVGIFIWWLCYKNIL